MSSAAVPGAAAPGSRARLLSCSAVYIGRCAGAEAPHAMSENVAAMSANREDFTNE
jgi:hypothetical protein